MCIKKVCPTKTNYPVIVPIGKDCWCERRSGHEGHHLGKGHDGTYFFWRYEGVHGCILEEQMSEAQAQAILDADEEEEQKFATAAE